MNEYKNIKQVDGFAWCPICGAILIWGKVISEDIQECHCYLCDTKFIAKLTELEG